MHFIWRSSYSLPDIGPSSSTCEVRMFRYAYAISYECRGIKQVHRVNMEIKWKWEQHWRKVQESIKKQALDDRFNREGDKAVII